MNYSYNSALGSSLEKILRVKSKAVHKKSTNQEVQQLHATFHAWENTSRIFFVKIVFKCDVFSWVVKSLAYRVMLSLTMPESQETSAVASDTDVQYNMEQIINLYVL